MAFRVNSVKTSFFGKGAVSLLIPELKKMGVSRALIVTDPFLYQSGAADYVGEALSKAGLAYAVYHQVQPNPTVTVVNECITAAKLLQIDLLVAVGGGSAIDTAKAASIVTANGGRVEDYEGVNRSAKPGIPIVAVNTTAGTGSECTSFYIVTDPVRHSKMAMVDPNCMVTVAVNDIELMMSMPPKLTASTGLDALTHAIEALLAKGANPMTDRDALWAMETIWEYLPRAVRNGRDEEARTRMAYAEYAAGMAFSNAGLGMVHAMAHALGGHSNLPHGVCNAVLLPYVIDFNAQHSAEARERMPRISAALSLPDGRPYTLVQALRRTAAEMGIPGTLKEMGGVSREDFGDLAGLALKDACMADNLYTPSADEVISVYENAWTGK
ncbi:MAG: iron-containing alcohol dehydrogenase [Clostridia bacterium]|nr:iron-containing alcohol dehydrogenase [Clostridia bacterium]